MQVKAEKLQNEINEKFNSEFEIIGEFKNRRTHTKFKHKICGYEWSTSPSNFLRSKGCPKCNKTRKNITTESFKKEVLIITNNEYELIGKYTGAIKKTMIKHNKCGRIYETTPHDFISGGRCPMCWNESKFGKLQKDTAQFIEEVKERYKDEYTIVGEYLGARTKIEVRHNKCNNIFKISPDNLLRGRNCPYCAKHTPYNNKLFSEKIYELYNGEYTLLSEYKSMHEKIKVKHNKCGSILNIEANSLIRNKTCYVCNGRKRRTQEEFIREVKSKLGEDYTVLGQYKNYKTRVLIKHEKCKNKFKVIPESLFLGKIKCPYCNTSNGENKIRVWLEINNFKYKPQYRIDKCRNKYKLAFDFAVFDKCKNLKCLIEYDGIQHFEPIEYFGGEKSLKSQKIRDSIKTQYCNENNIRLIRITYYEFENIESILRKELLNETRKLE